MIFHYIYLTKDTHNKFINLYTLYKYFQMLFIKKDCQLYSSKSQT